MIAVGETLASAAEVPFFLPLTSDPINSGLTGHTFVSGEVELNLPGGGGWFAVATSQIVEKGFGRYCVQLTPSQCALAGMAYIRVRISGDPCQPYSGDEEIGTLPGDIPLGGSDVFVFDLPNGSDPIFGSPITGHSFVTGEVKICLPGGSYANANTADISEIGMGLYTLAITTGETTNRGKVFVYVSVSGSQRFEGYLTILGGEAPPPPVDYSTSGVVASDIADQVANFYGEDIWYDMASADPQTGKADYVVTAAGDWALATGLDALRQALLRRLITSPGEWATLPDFGVGAPQYVKAPRTAANVAELEGRIRSQFMQDDRVQSVSTVDITDTTNEDGSVTTITVLIVAAGSLQSAAPIPVVYSVQT